MTTTVSHDAIRNKFLATSYLNGTLYPEEAAAMADFFAEVGGVLVDKIEPVLKAYHQRIEDNVRNSTIEEIIADLNSANGMIFTRNSVIARLRSYRSDSNHRKA